MPTFEKKKHSKNQSLLFKTRQKPTTDHFKLGYSIKVSSNSITIDGSFKNKVF